MKKKFSYFILIMIALGILAACNDSNENSGENEENNETETATEPNNEESNDGTDEEEEENKNSDENVVASELEITMEDQEGLGIGDTGIFDTVVGDFELTLNKAELVGKELDGEQSQLDDLIRLELTVKNIDDITILAEEVMSNMEVTEDLEGQGTVNYAEYFDSARLFKGEIEPGEELTADIITDVYTAETYYLRRDSGNVAAEYSNQVIWEIPVEEAKQQ